MPVDKFGRMSDTKTRDTGVSLTYINNNYILNDGSTFVSSSLNMNGNTLYNVPDPVNPQDVATKEYADNVGEKIKHLVVVHARYFGPLKKGEYPFKFSGGNFKTCEEDVEKYKDFKGSATGFLMPHSGRIKKIIVEGLNLLDIYDFLKKIIEGLDGERLEEVKKGFEEYKKKVEKIRTKFSTIDKKEKFFLKIVKFEKNLNEEDYPQLNYNSPKIISSILIDEFKGVSVSFMNDVFRIGAIFRVMYQNDEALSEGDVINIESIDDFPRANPDFNIDNHKIPLEAEFTNKLIKIMFKRFSYNFTLLIELDPL